MMSGTARRKTQAKKRVKPPKDGRTKAVAIASVDADNVDVLHLSDLHLLGKNLSDRYDLLFKDISSQTGGFRSIILVVTGDIASYGKVKDSEGAILAFFTKLKSSIKAKVVDVELVPGNHDIDRNCFLSTKDYEAALAEYGSLAKRIYRIFNLKKADCGVYGASRIRCGGRSICFLRLDTSWYLNEKEFKGMVHAKFAKEMMGWSKIEEKWPDFRDCRAQRILEYQRKQMISVNDALSYCKNAARGAKQPVGVVVALAHHPLSWLVKTSCQSYADYLAEIGIPEVDIWMCGHAHDVKLHYDNDDNRSTVVLMTGVGSDERMRAYHRYSIYHLSLSRNVCSILVRSSTCGKPFKDDSTLLPTETSPQTRHFCYPLETRAPGSILQLNTDAANPHRELFVDQRVIALMRILANHLFALQDRLKLVMRGHVIRWRMARWDKKRGRRVRFVSLHERSLMFVDFLGQITNEVVAALLMRADADDERALKTLRTEDCDEIWQTNWRAHFRICGMPTLPARTRYNTYRCVAKTAKKILFGGKKNMSGMHDMKWDTLISAANSHQLRCLVRSVNDKPVSCKTKWDDYLTSIPQCAGNYFRYGNENRPILTFGLSAKSRNYVSAVIASRILYLLEFFNINRLISQSIDEYLHRTRFSIEMLQR